MSNTTYKDHSRGNWYNSLSQNPTLDELQTGALQRIADATELMAKNYLHLQAEAQKYKRWYESEVADNKRLGRSNAAYKGMVNKLKKRKP